MHTGQPPTPQPPPPELALPFGRYLLQESKSSINGTPVSVEFQFSKKQANSLLDSSGVGPKKWLLKLENNTQNV
jgi:hypothetical protein